VQKRLLRDVLRIRRVAEHAARQRGDAAAMAVDEPAERRLVAVEARRHELPVRALILH